MFKKNSFFSFVAFISILFFQCAGITSKGTVIKGKITDASDLRVFLDQQPLTSRRIEVISQSELSSNGKFTIKTEKQLEPGIYRIRISDKYVNLVIDGSEKTIDITGSLADMNDGKCVIKGSPESVKINELQGKLNNKQIGYVEIQNAAKEATNPFTALYLIMGALSTSKDNLDIMKNIVIKLREKYPKSSYTTSLDNLATGMEREILAEASAAKVKIGAEAPNISLPNPDGKVINLNSLRGKVVLLDFWASWCGPCRRENPNVVNIYNKYKDKGFTVYSVSLDRPGAMDNWKQAIAQDKLTWPNHVSDLQHWNSIAGRMYGIQSIPQTYLLDKNGIIVESNLRGEALEPAIKKYL